MNHSRSSLRQHAWGRTSRAHGSAVIPAPLSRSHSVDSVDGVDRRGRIDSLISDAAFAGSVSAIGVKEIRLPPCLRCLCWPQRLLCLQCQSWQPERGRGMGILARPSSRYNGSSSFKVQAKRVLEEDRLISLNMEVHRGKKGQE